MNPLRSLVFSPPTSLLLHASQRTGTSHWVTRQVSASWTTHGSCDWLGATKQVKRLGAFPFGSTWNRFEDFEAHEVSEPMCTHFVFLLGAASEYFPFGLSEMVNLCSLTCLVFPPDEVKHLSAFVLEPHARK